MGVNVALRPSLMHNRPVFLDRLSGRSFLQAATHLPSCGLAPEGWVLTEHPTLLKTLSAISQTPDDVQLA
jgi:hypothetical protein